MPGMNDPNFAETLTLVCEHNRDGAFGFTVNRPFDIEAKELLKQQGIDVSPDQSITQQMLFSGGPVEVERGFVLHTPDRKWDGTMEVSDDFAVTASEEVLHAIVDNEGPAKYMFILGYSGWSSGQLESEIQNNVWLTAPASSDIVFDIEPEQRWTTAAQRLGVDLSLLSSDPGHA